MKLSKLIENIEVRNVIGSLDVEINEVNIDSRKIGPNHLFVAMPS